ncbi:DUF3624 domain-containing protein [Vibrio agarivorans]|uniref:DUF3624 domain-containing protein n=1 Tax=Vibrio agarivorans TaxID=153622 RepID=UPI00222F5057|nr:DUF3624 domain-containing protein [Vibrio agarivorans]
MSCQNCQQHWSWKKIGRCQRCMDQLTVLSVACWGLWWFFFRDDPKSIESITLMMAGFAFNVLLVLHLLMKFIVLPMRGKK